MYTSITSLPSADCSVADDVAGAGVVDASCRVPVADDNKSYEKWMRLIYMCTCIKSIQ